MPDPCVDISAVYTSDHGGAVLRCTEHPEWETDIDGAALPDVIRRAERHVQEDHDAQ